MITNACRININLRSLLLHCNPSQWRKKIQEIYNNTNNKSDITNNNSHGWAAVASRCIAAHDSMALEFYLSVRVLHFPHSKTRLHLSATDTGSDIYTSRTHQPPPPPPLHLHCTQTRYGVA